MRFMQPRRQTDALAIPTFGYVAGRPQPWTLDRWTGSHGVDSINGGDTRLEIDCLLGGGRDRLTRLGISAS